MALFIFALTSVAAAAPLMDFDKGKVAFDYTFRPSLDFGAGGEVKYHYTLPDATTGGDTLSASRNFDGDANLDLGLTIGIGNRWAVQYRQYNPSGTIWSGRVIDESSASETHSDYTYLNLSFDGKMRSDEFNLMYSLNKNWAAFAGVVSSSASIKTSARFGTGYTDGEDSGAITAGLTAPEIKSEDKNMFHFGVVGSYKVGDKTHLWGLASVGGDYRNWEAGISYDLGKDLQLNVNYRDTKWNKLGFGNGNFAYTETVGGVTQTASGAAEINAKDITVKGWGFGLTYKF